jgi:hypothetical protein
MFEAFDQTFLLFSGSANADQSGEPDRHEFRDDLFALQNIRDRADRL